MAARGLFITFEGMDGSGKTTQFATSCRASARDGANGSRAQNVEESILPALDRGEIVLADRFTDSTLAYQGCARGLGTDLVLDLDKIACRGLQPDLTLLLDISPTHSLARAKARNFAEANDETRMDEQGLEFHRRVYEAYQALADREPARVKRIDGTAIPDDAERAIWEVVRAYV
jgi:dTMP kinase